MADCYHVWVFRANVKGQVGTATIRRKCLSRTGANQNLKAAASDAFTRIKPGMVLACMGDGCPCTMRGRGCDRATPTVAAVDSGPVCTIRHQYEKLPVPHPASATILCRADWEASEPPEFRTYVDAQGNEHAEY